VPAKILFDGERAVTSHRSPAHDLEGKQGERAAMDSFSSPSLSSSGSSPNPEAVMEQIKAQLAQAYAQEFLEVRSPAIFPSLVVPLLMVGANMYDWFDSAC
jgi:hypothetical protein